MGATVANQTIQALDQLAAWKVVAFALAGLVVLLSVVLWRVTVWALHELRALVGAMREVALTMTAMRDTLAAVGHQVSEMRRDLDDHAQQEIALMRMAVDLQRSGSNGKVVDT